MSNQHLNNDGATRKYTPIRRRSPRDPTKPLPGLRSKEESARLAAKLFLVMSETPEEALGGQTMMEYDRELTLRTYADMYNGESNEG